MLKNMKLVMELEYDQPDDPYWMNPDNLEWLLNKHTGIKGLQVRWAEGGDPWRKSELVHGPGHGFGTSESRTKRIHSLRMGIGTKVTMTQLGYEQFPVTKSRTGIVKAINDAGFMKVKRDNLVRDASWYHPDFWKPKDKPKRRIEIE